MRSHTKSGSFGELLRHLRKRTGMTQGELACLTMRQGLPETSTPYFAECLEFCIDLGDKEGLLYCIEGLAELASGTHFKSVNHKMAIYLLSAATNLRSTFGIPLPPMEHPYYEATQLALRNQCSVEIFDASWVQGRKMSLEEAGVLAQSFLGEIDGMCEARNEP